MKIERGSTVPSGPGSPHYRGFTITFRHTSGRVISPTQRTLPDNTQHLQEKEIHAPGRIRTRSPSKPTATDTCLRPDGHWDWHECGKYGWKLMAFVVPVFTKLIVGQQIFMKIVSTEFYQNPTESVVKWCNNSFTQVSEMLLSPNRFSRNSQ
jgi:hypothetical protein